MNRAQVIKSKSNKLRQYGILYAILFLAFILTNITFVKAIAKASDGADEKDISFSLTEEEYSMVKKYNTSIFTLGVTDWRAYDVSDDGIETGYAAALIRMLKGEFGITTNVILLNEDDVHEALCNKDVDFVLYTGDDEYSTACSFIMRTGASDTYEKLIGTGQNIDTLRLVYTNDEYSELMSCIARLMTTQEADVLAEEMTSDYERLRIEKFLDENNVLINEVISTYNGVIYGKGDANAYPMTYVYNGTVQGICRDMCDFFKAMSGIDFVIRLSEDENDSLSELVTGEIQFMYGFICKNDNEYMQKSAAIYSDNIVPVIPLKTSDIQLSEDELDNAYWGCITSAYEMLQSTGIGKMTVEYSNYDELLKGLSSDNISGVLIPEKMAEYLNSGQPVYMIQESLSFPYESVLTLCPDNEDLNNLLDSMLENYLNQNITFGIKKDNTIKENNGSKVIIQAVSNALYGIPEWTILAVMLLFAIIGIVTISKIIERSHK